MSNSSKTLKNQNSSVQQHMPVPGRSMKPPGSAPMQLKEPSIRKKDRKDAEMGPVREGEIAVKGFGDDHAFAANDVNQGGLGDCYFLASLMTLCNSSPKTLESAISKKDDGTYDVKLFKRKGLLGMGGLSEKTINVTASFVVHKGTDQDYYANGGDRDDDWNQELWVKLIEKAYAKMHGGYGKIHGGFEQDALESLTGQEHSSHGFGGFLGMGKTSDADLKSNIKGALDADKPVTAATGSQGKIDKADKKAGTTFAKDNDIVGRHAYAVMAADDNSIRLRNPWGSGASVAEPVLDWSQFRSYYVNYTTRD